jgi:hypothetical protein
MVLLIQGERQVIIDLLSKLPGIDVYPHVRHSLTATLPADLRNSIPYTNTLNIDIAGIVDMVTEDTWTQLPDGSYPILVVLENALNKVRGSELGNKLFNQMNVLRTRLGLPLIEIQSITPPEPFLDDFLQKLYDFIHQIPILKDLLRETSNAFGHYILKPRCKTVNARFIEACSPVHEFTAVLEQSDNLQVKAHRGWLSNALLGFNNQAKVIVATISEFCDMYGTSTPMNQPDESRREIRQQLDKLMRCSESVLTTAKILYRDLSSR